MHLHRNLLVLSNFQCWSSLSLGRNSWREVIIIIVRNWIIEFLSQVAVVILIVQFMLIFLHFSAAFKLILKFILIHLALLEY